MEKPKAPLPYLFARLPSTSSGATAERQDTYRELWKKTVSVHQKDHQSGGAAQTSS